MTSWRGLRRAQWSSRAPRYLFTAVLLVFFAVGVRTVVFGFAGSSPAAAASQESSDISSQEFALQFARAYLSYDAAQPQTRIEALAPFVGSGLNASAGFSANNGVRRVVWADVASDQSALAGGRIITVAVEVSDQTDPLYLAVTVIRGPGGALDLGGYPSLIGAPAIGSASAPVTGPEVTDGRVTVVVGRALRNYLAGATPNLKADLTANAIVTLPTLRLRVESVEEMVWVGSPGSGAVLATVSASDGSGDLYTLTYELGVVNRERPYVDFIEVVPTDG